MWCVQCTHCAFLFCIYITETRAKDIQLDFKTGLEPQSNSRCTSMLISLVIKKNFFRLLFLSANFLYVCAAALYVF